MSANPNSFIQMNTMNPQFTLSHTPKVFEMPQIPRWWSPDTLSRTLVREGMQIFIENMLSCNFQENCDISDSDVCWFSEGAISPLQRSGDLVDPSTIH